MAKLKHGTRQYAKPKSLVSLAQEPWVLSVKNYDWDSAWRVGEDVAKEQVRRGDPIDDRAIMWALLCDAIRTSAIAYRGPPHMGWPAKSTLPDAPDEISQWQKIAAYLRGDLDEMPIDEGRSPLPDAKSVSRAEHVLWVWHRYALIYSGDKSKMRKAVYLKAGGVPDRKIRAITGFSRDKIKHSRRTAMDDMIKKIMA